MNLDDFDYQLPESAIAKHPITPRDRSQLLIVDQQRNNRSIKRFYNLIDHLNPQDCLVFNDTKVMQARLLGRKSTGAQIECLIERIISPQQAMGLVKSNHPLKPDTTILFGQKIEAKIIRAEKPFVQLEFNQPIHHVLDRIGQLPIPPYLKRSTEASDYERYQTVLARHLGSVAAPTAGLHFTEELLQLCRQKGIGITSVTLHVGAGTFLPIRTTSIDDHRMHGEWYNIPEKTIELWKQTKAAGGRVFAVGTTTVRALESSVKDGIPTAGETNTNLFIKPGHTFHSIDGLITNFHLPKSTLLVMLSALIGRQALLGHYAYALENNFRFYSYGDAMLIK
ncbi:tRNA preQ1(34) S-adenosylmethionine ribosyltransferase-isomerase QueA [Gammaproteobacteria bacterium]|nr:tRNA preQ1(34) S-adenosylmethionine ribosyltransferase-isomerase QueA [Gammaproteobacteria bacterium]